MLLHPRRKLRACEAFLSHLTDSLLTFVLVLLHHHLKAWNQDSPRNDSRSELVQHLSVDVLVPNCRLSCFFNVAFVEREWLLGSFGLCHARFLVFNPSLLLGLENFLIQRLFGSLGDVVCLKGDLALSLFSQLALCFILLESMLADSLLVLMLQESGWLWDSDVVLALATLRNEVHLSNHFLL